MGEVNYNDCDCVPGHMCDCREAAAAARTALLDELEAAVEALRRTQTTIAVLHEIKKQRRP